MESLQTPHETAPDRLLPAARELSRPRGMLKAAIAWTLPALTRGLLVKLLLHLGADELRDGRPGPLDELLDRGASGATSSPSRARYEAWRRRQQKGIDRRPSDPIYRKDGLGPVLRRTSRSG